MLRAYDLQYDIDRVATQGRDLQAQNEQLWNKIAASPIRDKLWYSEADVSCADDELDHLAELASNAARWDKIEDHELNLKASRYLEMARVYLKQAETLYLRAELQVRNASS